MLLSSRELILAGVWVVHRQPFDLRCGIEFTVGGDQGRFRESKQTALVTQIQDSGKLHCIVAAQVVVLRQVHGPQDNAGSDIDWKIGMVEVGTKSDDCGKGILTCR